MTSGMLTRSEYDRSRVLEIEKELTENLYPFACFTESMFRSQALPILVGLIDDTFDEQKYINCVGSPMVGLQVVADNDISKLLFTIPALYYSGASVLSDESEPSLTEEAAQIDLQANIISSVGAQARAEFVLGVVDGIDDASYSSNYERARRVIQLLNSVFERYGVKGRLAYPDGLAEITPQEEVVAKPEKAPEVDFGSIDDDEFL